MWKCKAYKKQFSVKVGTIFEDSALGLNKWLPAVWLIANSKNGISSTGSFEKFSGTVEVDETLIGGKARNMHKSVRKQKISGTGGIDTTASSITPCCTSTGKSTPTTSRTFGRS